MSSFGREAGTAVFLVMLRVTAKLLYLSKQAVDLQWIFAEQPAFQKKLVRWADAVAYFAKAAHTLIRINTNERTRARSGFYDDCHTQVGDLQIRWLRICIDVSGIGFEFMPIEQLRDAKNAAEYLRNSRRSRRCGRRRVTSPPRKIPV